MACEESLGYFSFQGVLALSCACALCRKDRSILILKMSLSYVLHISCVCDCVQDRRPRRTREDPELGDGRERPDLLPTEPPLSLLNVKVMACLDPFRSPAENKYLCMCASPERII